MDLENAVATGKVVVARAQPISDAFRLVKDALIFLLVLGSIVFFGVGVYKSASTQGIDFEPLQVPSQFSDKGFTQQIATVRLVDELKKISQTANTTKRRDALSSKQPGEELSKVSAAIPSGIDVAAVQAIIREFLGIQKKSIAGDITVVGDGKADKYLVRIRQNPDEILLVDAVVEGSPEEVLKTVGIKLVEKIDPVVAASYYRIRKQYIDTLRMVDVALASKNIEDKSFALDQRIYIYVDQKKFDLAKRDLDAIFSIHKDSANGYGMLTLWYREQGMYKEALESAEKQISLRPDLPHGYFNKGGALIGLGKDAEEWYLKALDKPSGRLGFFLEIGNYLESKGKLDKARESFMRAAVSFPDSAAANFAYGRLLMSDDEQLAAFYYLQRAYKLDPKNRNAQELLLKAIPENQENDLRNELRKALGGGK